MEFYLPQRSKKSSKIIEFGLNYYTVPSHRLNEEKNTVAYTYIYGIRWDTWINREQTMVLDVIETCFNGGRGVYLLA